MKIYSLQEENDKLNASRGVIHPGINHGMFDVKKTTAPVRQQRRTSSPSTRQGKWTSPTTQQGKWTSPTAQQGKWTSPAAQKRQPSPASQPQRTPAPPRQEPSSGQKRRLGMLVGWIILMLFLALVNYLSDMI